MILETADLHLNANPRDAYRHTFMAGTLPTLLQKHHVSTLIVLGDLCDEKDRHPAWLVNAVVRHFTKLSKLVDEVIINLGNHDYVEAGNPFYAFLGQLPKIRWVHTPTTLSLEGKKVLFLPHTANYKRNWKGLDFKGYARIYVHQTFQGAAVGPRKLDGIPLDIFPDNARVISGDIHVPQSFDVVTYIGAPYLCDFGDDYKPRVLLRDGNTATSIPVPGVQKRLVEIEDIVELKHPVSYKGLINTGDILKVRVLLNTRDRAQWPAMKEAVLAWGEKNGFQIYLVQPVLEKEKGKATARQRTVVRTDEQLMSTYAKAVAVSDVTLKTGMSIMRKV